MKKTSILIFVALLVMVISAATLFSVPSIGTPSPEMIVERLTAEPEKYFVLTDVDIDTDPVLLQAIAQLGKPVDFSSLDETKIDELTNQHGTPNFEYDNNYYRVGILVGDPAEIYSQLFWLSFLGIIVSVALIAFLVIFKGIRYLKKGITKEQIVLSFENRIEHR